MFCVHLQIMRCKSCNNLLKSKDLYCSKCGSKVVRKRLSFRGTFSEFIVPFLSWDNYFIKTIYHLIVCPQKVLSAFVEGARKKYFNPFSFLIVYATIALIVEKISGDWRNTIKIQSPKGVKISETIITILDFTEEYYNLMIILTIPLLALVSSFLYRKYVHNYVEHLVFQAYLGSFLGYFSLLLQFLEWQFSKDFRVFPFLFIWGYYNYAFVKLYQLNFKQIIKVNLKLFLVVVLVIIFTLILGSLIPKNLASV